MERKEAIRGAYRMTGGNSVRSNHWHEEVTAGFSASHRT